MNGKTFARLATAAAACGLTAAATLGSATADPAATPVDAGIEQLTATAGNDPAAREAVGSLANTAHLISAAKLDHIAGGFTPFMYQAPTFGCGTNFPVSLTAVAGAAGVPGPDRGIAGEYATVRFQATPNMWGYPTDSGLTVAWLNTGNGRSGVATLDERTETGTPSLTKTVASGPGTIIATMWGTIGYPGATCVMTPTVGVITVYPNPLTDPYAPRPETPRPGQSNPSAPGAASTETPLTAPDAPAN
ncbi:hypothetical protein BJY24_001259 [Nocardia transvalensis]|uniref:Uncharacterized protein n=1 Tax=Nocardia transvalensis TaxID=37333 RepID=A0A7W9UGQ9_9NOCA|nr:hypothetical protein [Nocardia transvalensis]MBB5912392.1 hypothetical protein [Nocardia transvalensis]